MTFANLMTMPFPIRLVSAFQPGVILLLASGLFSQGRAQVEADEPGESAEAVEKDAGLSAELFDATDLRWGLLNAKRGDKSPRAVNLWGDRADTGATGFMVKFIDGFSSPPHIHNVTYRGVVIQGLVHNDDPAAPDMWMPPGSFWTQPAGDVHITSAKGATNGAETIAYIEIEQGPYLVLPSEEAFDKGERPINAHASNIVWLDATATGWIATPGAEASEAAPSADSASPQIAFLWGKPAADQANGTLLELPPRFSGQIQPTGPDFRAVIVKGEAHYKAEADAEATSLPVGSYFGSAEAMPHFIACAPENACKVYIRSKGPYRVETN